MRYDLHVLWTSSLRPAAYKAQNKGIGGCAELNRFNVHCALVFRFLLQVDFYFQLTGLISFPCIIVREGNYNMIYFLIQTVNCTIGFVSTA